MMLALINELTDMPEWHRKIYDNDFTFRWRSEKVMSGIDVHRSMVDWCVEEVKYYVENFLRSGVIPAIDGGVIKSDCRISSVLKNELQRTIAYLRRDACVQLSTHDVVVDVVDPYLFPFAWARTRTLGRGELTLSKCISRSGEGETVKMPLQEDCVQKDPAKYPSDMAWSRRFQYLPFDVKFDNRGEGGSRVTSYINNVHPTAHQDFYSVLEKLIDAAIPMFNQTLMDLKAPGHSNQRFHVAVLGREPMIVKEPAEFRPPQQRATSQWLDSRGRFQDWLFVDLKKEFWNIGLQMVLHVMEIDLNPENSCYEGEEWHVKGRLNERICATALYAYSIHNTTSASLSFRRRVNAEEAMLAKGYIQSPPWATDLYGARSGDPVIQHMGDITLSENRLITYPNTFQTRLLPVELTDKSKPGHVKLVILHLVDPNRRMMSTAMVPPQRQDWWAQEVRVGNTRLSRLPREVWDRIVEMVEGYPIGMEEGKELRREFKTENARAREKHTRAMMDYLEWDLDWEDDE